MTDVRTIAYDLTERSHLKHRFDRNTKFAGRELFLGFTRRHPDLTIKLTTSTSLTSMNGFNQKAVKRCFDPYRGWTTKHLEL